MERAAADTDRDAAALKFTVLSQFHLSSLELPVGDGDMRKQALPFRRQFYTPV